MVNCLNCGLEFKPFRGSASKFCCNKCQHEFKAKELDKRFLDGEKDIYTHHKSQRKFLIRRDGEKCSCCGITDWNKKPITLEVEHKDGNSENNTSDNLCLICPNCHSQTDTYKGKNVGNGRYKRRIRYQEGKSY